MKVFYHKADLDGLASAAIIQSTTEWKDAEFIGVDYGDYYDFKKIEKNEKVIVADFTFEPFSQMLELSKISNLLWIDHHWSSIKEFHNHFSDYGLVPFAPGTIPFKYHLGYEKNTKSAALLVWEYFYPDRPATTGLKMISDYDVWKHDHDPDIEFFQLGLRNKVTTFENYTLKSAIFENDNGFIESLIDDGRFIKNYLVKEYKNYAKEHAFEGELVKGLPGIFINRAFTGSPLFDSVYNPEKHKLMVVYTQRNDKRWHYSLYTTHDDVDCGAIAKSLGGGGHKKAAGFNIKECLT